VQVSQLATSLSLQRAIVTQDSALLHSIARAKHARITLHGHAIGTLAPGPRIASTATITDGIRVLARITVALPLDQDVLTVLQQATPLPKHAVLLLVRNGRVIAGGPHGARSRIVSGRVTFGRSEFAAAGAKLGVAHASILAVEPVAAIDAISQRYRRLVFLAAAFTLALAAALAARLARPLAQAVGDVARLTRQVQTDSLTNLANRRGLTERLDAELARAHENGTSVSFVIADIDNFKAVNDGYGHQTGDQIIRAAAQALAGTVRELDLAARYGGEEFAVVLPGARLADARRSAERMRRAVSQIEVPGPNGESARVTMSFGVAEFPTYAGAEALVAAADAALYQAKRGGKDQVATATVNRKRSPAADDAAASLAPLG
jgi:diguanylate cyclase (GGDEF)-like protein